MRILVTGADGQLGRAFAAAGGSDATILVGHRAGPDSVAGHHMDITRPQEVATLVASLEPDWVVHAAAMTNVDGCEREPQMAMAINEQGTFNVARAAKAVGARTAYLSTDYVFDGSAGDYSEDAATNPLSVYGKSKLGGENAVMAIDKGNIVVRTSVVHGPHRPNFVSWLITSLASARPVQVLSDQRVSPTATKDLHAMIMALISEGHKGIWNAAGADSASRLEMADAIAVRFGFSADSIQAAVIADMDWVAPRPADSSLNVTKISSVQPGRTFVETLDDYEEGAAQ